MNTYPVSITMPAALAGDLLEKVTPNGIWLRCETQPSGPAGEVLITIHGPCDEVAKFISENWGCEYDPFTRVLRDVGLWGDIELPMDEEKSKRTCPNCGRRSTHRNVHHQGCLFQNRNLSEILGEGK